MACNSLPSTIEVPARAARGLPKSPCMTMPFFSFSALVGPPCCNLHHMARLNACKLYILYGYYIGHRGGAPSVVSCASTCSRYIVPRCLDLEHSLSEALLYLSVRTFHKLRRPTDLLPAEIHPLSHLWNTHHALTHRKTRNAYPHAPHTTSSHPAVRLPFSAGGDFVLQSSFASLVKPSAERDTIF